MRPKEHGIPGNIPNGEIGGSFGRRFQAPILGSENTSTLRSISPGNESDRPKIILPAGEQQRSQSETRQVSTLVRPEKFRFVVIGTHKTAKEIQQERTGLLLFNELQRFQLPPELPKSQERKQQLTEMGDALATFAREELEIDLTHTLPQPRYFHFFDEETFKTVRSIQKMGDTEIFGEALPTGDMLIAEDPEINNTLAAANHEQVHAAVPTLAKITEEKRELISGIYNITGRTGISIPIEFLTSVTDVEVRGRYWQNYPSLAEVDNGIIGYHEAVIVGDTLLKKVASAQKRGYTGVLRDLQRGMFLIRPDTFKPIADVIGPNGMETLLNWDEDSPEATMKVAQDLGLKEAQSKLLAVRAGKPVTILDDIAPNFKVLLEVKS